MINGLQKRRRRRRRRQIRGRLGSEAGYSQAAPVAIWRYELQAVIVTKKEKEAQTNKQTYSSATMLSVWSSSATSTGQGNKNRSFNTSSIHAYIAHSLKSLICQQHINNIEPISIFISMFSEEHASQLDTVNCCHWKCQKL